MTKRLKARARAKLRDSQSQGGKAVGATAAEDAHTPDEQQATPAVDMRNFTREQKGQAVRTTIDRCSDQGYFARDPDTRQVLKAAGLEDVYDEMHKKPEEGFEEMQRAESRRLEEIQHAEEIQHKVKSMYRRDHLRELLELQSPNEPSCQVIRDRLEELESMPQVPETERPPGADPRALQ